MLKKPSKNVLALYIYLTQLCYAYLFYKKKLKYNWNYTVAGVIDPHIAAKGQSINDVTHKGGSHICDDVWWGGGEGFRKVILIIFGNNYNKMVIFYQTYLLL